MLFWQDIENILELHKSIKDHTNDECKIFVMKEAKT